MINVSWNVLMMLMRRTSRLTVEALVELGRHSIRDSLITSLEIETIHSIARRSHSKVDRFELSDPDQSTNP